MWGIYNLTANELLLLLTMSHTIAAHQNGMVTCIAVPFVSQPGVL